MVCDVKLFVVSLLRCQWVVLATVMSILCSYTIFVWPHFSNFLVCKFVSAHCFAFRCHSLFCNVISFVAPFHRCQWILLATPVPILCSNSNISWPDFGDYSFATFSFACNVLQRRTICCIVSTLPACCSGNVSANVVSMHTVHLTKFQRLFLYSRRYTMLIFRWQAMVCNVLSFVASFLCCQWRAQAPLQSVLFPRTIISWSNFSDYNFVTFALAGNVCNSTPIVASFQLCQ